MRFSLFAVSVLLVQICYGKESTEEFDNHYFARFVHNGYSDRCKIVLIDNANKS